MGLEELNNLLGLPAHGYTFEHPPYMLGLSYMPALYLWVDPDWELLGLAQPTQFGVRRYLTEFLVASPEEVNFDFPDEFEHRCEYLGPCRMVRVKKYKSSYRSAPAPESEEADEVEVAEDRAVTIGWALYVPDTERGL